MGLGDLLGDTEKSKLIKQNLKNGDVFLKKFKGINHPKFFIIAGISKTKIYLCSVYINSNIHPSIMSKQNLLELQVPLKKGNNPFLKYDSFANCSNPIPMETEPLSQWILNKSCKVIGTVFENDLKTIIQTIKNSGLLSKNEIDLYFS